MRKTVFLLLGIMLLLVGGVSAQDEPNLHVPSPEWRDQIIYFIMTDRFNDGDPSNNDQGAGEFDPTRESHYNGGDLAGIIEQLDYIQGLGATAIWITPPVSNQWWDPLVNYGGYHGYWAENFMALDPHVGTLEEYQALSDALHDNGMYLIQDIVVNHTGNFFSYEGGYNPNDPTENFTLNTESVPVTRPSQSPFDLNDINNPEHVEADIYHWTPSITNYDDPNQRENYQLSNLDDLNTENPLVRDVLRESYGYWIEQVGIDGFRSDTIIYVSHDFWNDFFYSDDPDAPGIEHVAAATGREEFFNYGEAFIGSGVLDSTGEQRISQYLGDEAAPEFDAVLNFPLHFTINQVFAEGMPTHYMTYRLNATMEHFPDPYILPNFIDNHDVDRFLSRGTVAGLQQATMFLMTAPGIPVIYYGTEQAFDQRRAAMFAEGWESGGEDHFDTESEMYQWIQSLAEIRKSNLVFSRGTIEVLQDNPNGAGVLAYRRNYEDQTALVIFNTAESTMLAANIPTGLEEGTVLDLLQGINQTERVTVGNEGMLTLELTPREGMILMPVEEQAVLGQTEAVTIEVDSEIEGATLTEDTELSGTVSEPGAALRLVINGNLDTAVDFTADDDGNWQVILPISGFPPGQSENSLMIYAPESRSVSSAYTFTAEVTATGSTVTAYDEIGDTVGPLGTYQLPTDETFGEQLDILQTQVSASGAYLEVSLTMGEVTTVWGPANGFDHVLFHVYIDLPGEEGVTVLPRINANAPEGFAWDRMAFIEGWNNRLYTAEGASAEEYGTQVNPAAEISVEGNVITFLFPAESLGNPESLEGAQVYITTWDWDGPASNYRGLGEFEAQWAFSGGDFATDPLILDSTDVITVPADVRHVRVDPAGDDVGPMGTYELPTDETFGEQLDITQASYSTFGSTMQISVQMGEITTVWGPQNGFDHVLFHIYVDLPGEEGATVLPLINANAPEGFAWDRMIFAEGWNNRLYSAEGAGADSYGTQITPPAEISVDEASNTISFLLSAEALGNPESLEGAQVYITTWDWDGPAGNYRALNDSPAQWTFSGGDGEVDPLILDDVLIGRPVPYVSAVTTPTVDVTFTLTSVPENTPEDARFFIVGPFNNMDPGGGDFALELTPNGDGTHSITLTFEEGVTVPYRFTRGSWITAEKIDPDDRFAERELVVTPETTNVEVEITGWWDD